MKLDPELFEDASSAFYYRAIPNPKGSKWFSKQPVVHNTLATMVQSMCQSQK